MTEAWAEIPGYGGRYEVSTYGRVRAFHHTAKVGSRIKVLKPRGRYDTVTLCEPGGRHVEARVHRLVAGAFIPTGCATCDVHHEDWQRSHNHLHNLAWLSKPEHRRLKRPGVTLEETF